MKIQEFEYLEAAPGTALLRIRVRAPYEADPNAPPTLLIDDGTMLHRRSPLRVPPAPDGAFRLAYSAPLAMLERGVTVFRLELAAVVVDLPTPVRRARRSAPTPAQRLAVDERSPAEQSRAAGQQLPFQAVLGICLMVLGVTFAVLILAGAVKT